MLRFVALLLPALAFGQEAKPPSEVENALTRYARAIPDSLLVRPYRNEFSVSLRFLGNSSVRFSGMGEIRTDFEDDDSTSLANRVYADGYVALDARGQSADGEAFSDGLTNTWSYDYADQITPEGDGIMFHAYAASPSDAVIEAETPQGVNPDLEYSRVLYQWGKPVSPRRKAWQLGLLAGWGLSDVNAKYNGSTTADLIVITDTYSLNGAPVPYDYDSDGEPIEGYTAPSSRIIEVVGDDGVTTTYVVDNTTLLGSRPVERTVETIADGAQIDGFWQMSGAYFTLRSGPWVRWEPFKNMSLKLSGGGTFTLIGLSMNYREKLVINDDIESPEIGEQSGTMTETFAGIYGSVDGEWSLNERTSLFASAYYEDFDEELSLEIDGRQAQAEVASGLGLRIGVTTRF
ncbi:hypothetical protein [Actomonas aquatica]|uniref:Uncharacterized protein n=1 Tax=Actomonas aquatica TaxID=2866162 RepID=A0ABZ1CGB0_9BACT|nr:hypothetical protein [Opitutus sp. WL0086]WRQ89604.1 hypothetical protein K1X11_009300 [Opitutus sp. WL0086]